MLRRLLWLFILASISILAAPPAAAQTQTVTYTLDDLWLDPNITRPFDPPQQMTGTFTWTYTPGDFENGSGQFLSLDIPWAHPALNELAITIDLDQIEFSLIGNFQNYSADVSLFLQTPLDPGHAASLDLVRSKFTIENGQAWQGVCLRGSIVPDTALDLLVSGTCPSHTMTVARVTPLGLVAPLHANGVGNILVPNDLPCAGTLLGLNNSASLGVLVTANAAGTATYSANLPPRVCGNVFLQALDLSSCGTSQVVKLE
jgi:hypothetical protein